MCFEKMIMATPTEDSIKIEQFQALARLYAAGIRLSCTRGDTDNLPSSYSQMRDIVKFVRDGDPHTLGVYLTNDDGSLFVNSTLDGAGGHSPFCSIAPARFDQLIQVSYKHNYARDDDAFYFLGNHDVPRYFPGKSTLLSLNRIDRDRNWLLVIETVTLGKCHYTIDERLTLDERRRNLPFNLHWLAAGDLSH